MCIRDRKKAWRDAGVQKRFYVSRGLRVEYYDRAPVGEQRGASHTLAAWQSAAQEVEADTSPDNWKRSMGLHEIGYDETSGDDGSSLGRSPGRRLSPTQTPSPTRDGAIVATPLVASQLLEASPWSGLSWLSATVPSHGYLARSHSVRAGSTSLSCSVRPADDLG